MFWNPGYFLGDASKVIAALYIINFLASLAIIFIERKDPSATLVWLMVLFILPGAGIIVYLILSQNISRRRIFKLSESEEIKIRKELTVQRQRMESGTFEYATESARNWQDLVYLNQKYADALLTQGNKIEILTEGTGKFEALLEDINSAKESIHIEYFILKPDYVGKSLLDALTKKAKEGITVRLLLDAMGSARTPNRIFKPFLEAGGNLAFFFPPKRYISLKVNYRNHRKLAVIDSRVGYIGGFNVAKEYVGDTKKFGNWRDTHMRVFGPCVKDIDERFILDWRFASGEELEIANRQYPKDERSEDGKSCVQIVSSGPDSMAAEIKFAYMKMISAAKKNIYIQTPYFVPDSGIYEALRMAAHSGIDVQLMIPNQPDHPFVYWVTYANAAHLMEDGVKVYIYEDGFLHAKTITVDGEVSSIGSANFDMRSFKLNFEANAIIYDSEVAKEMERIFKKDIENSRIFTSTEYENRSIPTKFKEAVGRLFSGIL